MIRFLTCCMAALLAVSSAAEQPQKSEPLLHQLARILGVDRSPRNLKGPVSAPPGELWIAPVDHGMPRRVVVGNNFQTPVFQPGGKYLYALQDSELVHILLPNGPAAGVRQLPGVVKLLGFDRSRPDRLLAIFAAGPNLADVVLVSVRTGRWQTIASRQPVDNPEIQSLLGWERRYGNVYVLPQGHNVIVSGIQRDDLKVSDCGGDWCSQPSFSPELRQVAFIRSPGK